MTAGDLVTSLIDQIGLGGDSSAYTLCYTFNDGE